ncbi:hypothetical protein B0O99DRAFT_113746 [Bisporella sp. PMI_857]|nr:hypothetical protein B0O99DRAFT_113746 [Bisporella sp. PMI_857]
MGWGAFLLVQSLHIGGMPRSSFVLDLINTTSSKRCLSTQVPVPIVLWRTRSWGKLVPHTLAGHSDRASAPNKSSIYWG